MKKTILYFKSCAPLLLTSFFLAVVPFIVLRKLGIGLKELPFMFIVLLGMIKLFLAKSRDPKTWQLKARRLLRPNASKQEVVNAASAMETAQDLALLFNAVLILILNIFIS